LSGVNTLGVSDRLPEWMRSVRFRITILYSTILFVLAATLLGALYLALEMSLSRTPMYNKLPYIDQFGQEGSIPWPNFERAINEHALDNLARFSFAALGVLFVVSLGVGWVISGRVLSPIDRITDVARRIQATDLSQRIELEGPHDELKRLADTFDGMLERLDAAFAMQRRFIADASHELRNPLAVIRTNLDVDLADPSASREELRRTALVVRRATERMTRLVDDLLALARLESPDPVREPVDVASVVDEVAEEFATLAAERSISIERSLEPEIAVLGDREALKRALVNLVDNALRFSPERSRIVIGGGRSQAWVWLAVEDQGVGIAPQDQATIFDRFARADRSRSRDRGGSGLGLSIVRQIVESHGGTVRVSSEVGRGSTFVVWLPSADVTARLTSLDAPPESSPKPRSVTA
jgi:signal transduction histidine kinase